MDNKKQSNLRISGKCCDCGYIGEKETKCPNREDKTHCECWWDGPDQIQTT